jgi:hypothetical protein
MRTILDLQKLIVPEAENMLAGSSTSSFSTCCNSTDTELSL